MDADLMVVMTGVTMEVMVTIAEQMRPPFAERLIKESPINLLRFEAKQTKKRTLDLPSQMETLLDHSYPLALLSALGW